jgi:hypothetical protein
VFPGEYTGDPSDLSPAGMGGFSWTVNVIASTASMISTVPESMTFAANDLLERHDWSFIFS